MYRSRSGSTQPEALSIEFPTPIDEPEGVNKLKGKRKKKELPKRGTKMRKLPFDSPAMGTRSKRLDHAS